MSYELAGILIAGVGALLGWIFGVRSERSTKEQLRIDAMSFASSWYSDLRSWASEAINILSESAYLNSNSNTRPKKETQILLLNCRSIISALIDRGRFYFPNQHHDKYGVDKPTAYRGVRQPILDYLVAAERILSGDLSPNEIGHESITSALVEIKRQFVSASQNVLDPRTHIVEMNRILDTARLDQKSSDSKFIKYLNDSNNSSLQT